MAHASTWISARPNNKPVTDTTNIPRAGRLKRRHVLDHEHAIHRKIPSGRHHQLARKADERPKPGKIDVRPFNRDPSRLTDKQHCSAISDPQRFQRTDESLQPFAYPSQLFRASEMTCGEDICRQDVATLDMLSHRDERTQHPLRESLGIRGEENLPDIAGNRVSQSIHCHSCVRESLPLLCSRAGVHDFIEFIRVRQDEIVQNLPSPTKSVTSTDQARTNQLLDNRFRCTGSPSAAAKPIDNTANPKTRRLCPARPTQTGPGKRTSDLRRIAEDFCRRLHDGLSLYQLWRTPFTDRAHSITNTAAGDAAGFPFSDVAICCPARPFQRLPKLTEVRGRSAHYAIATSGGGANGASFRFFCSTMTIEAGFN